MREAVIVGNAPWTWHQGTARLVAGAGLVIAADGGANHLARIGLKPAAVVGDLDSISEPVRAWVGNERLVLRADQDFTDLHKALAYAFDEREVEKVTILAATGGRLDHALENLALLARWAARGDVSMRSEDAVVLPVLRRRSVPTVAGQTVSLLPLGACARVWTKGLKWPLAGEPLDLAERTGVSNVALGDEVEVRVEGGALVIVVFEPAPAAKSPSGTPR